MQSRTGRDSTSGTREKKNGINPTTIMVCHIIARHVPLRE